MVNRPPFDRDPPPSPGGFDPRFGGRGSGSSGTGRDRRFDYDQPGPEPAPDPRDPYAGRPDPYAQGPDARGHDPRRPDPYAQESDPVDRRIPPPPHARRGMARSTKMLLGLGLLLLLGALAFAWSLTRAGPGDDRLDGEEKAAANETAAAANAAAADPEARCAAPATYDRIKRELFRQAAATRGTDAATFDRLSGYAAVRVSSPVLREEDEGLERVSCAANVALDLPPGVQVVGGRRSLSANIGYNLQPAADGSGDVVTLTGADAITAPLATLARTPEPGSAPVPEPGPPTDGGFGQPVGTAPAPPVVSRPAPSPDRELPPPAEPAPPPPAPRQVAPPPRGTSASPSFNCARASNRAERAVCGSSELASLDRQMASRFFAARREANPTQRVLLDRTRGSFLAFRNRCDSNACIADAYRGRIREIGDIMADRWVAPR